MISIFIIICLIVVPNREEYTNFAMRQKVRILFVEF